MQMFLYRKMGKRYSTIFWSLQNWNTECVTDLDYQSEMIIFKLILIQHLWIECRSFEAARVVQGPECVSDLD